MQRLILIIFLTSLVFAQQQCDILIGGGTLASLGAAIVAPTTSKVCLVEPTDRLGGQLGDEGVWHIDFNWLYQAGYPDKTTAYNHANLHAFLRDLTTYCNTGDCWVSRNCFMYDCVNNIIQQYLAPKLKAGNLTIFYNSIIKKVEKKGKMISKVWLVSRTQKKLDCRSADTRIGDWYSSDSSEYYEKKYFSLTVNKFALQATQYGDLLVLSQAAYQQGTIHSDKCGQSIVFGLHQTYPAQKNLQKDQKNQLENDNKIQNSKDVFFSFRKNKHLFAQELKNHKKTANQVKMLDDDNFSLGGYSAEQVWRYRRLLGRGLNIKPGELTLQNWNGPGNDYKGGYLFQSVNEIKVDDWKGGINYTILKQAQARSLRFHEWFKNQSKLPLQATGKFLGTCSGVTRLPYIRDGRRSVGYKGFMMQQGDVTGIFVPDQKLTSTVFPDRLALGFYNMDVHQINNCQYDPFPNKLPLPFFLPARAFSNSQVSNLIVAGRAMAQEFYTSTATRTHSTELHSGIASMLMANYMLGAKISSTWAFLDCPSCILQLQEYSRKIMPLEWTIANKLYPPLQAEKVSQA